MAEKTFTLRLNNEIVLRLKASGDKETVDNFFKEQVNGTFGIAHRLEDSIVEATKNSITQLKTKKEGIE
jgi:hypothetical protein